MNMKDKNNELSRKNSELEARLKESKDMADASLLAVNEKQTEIFKQQSVIDLQRDKIAELEAELTQLKDGKSHVVGVEIPKEYLEEAFKNVMPVAKPIVWSGAKGACGDFKFFIAPDYNYESEWSDLEVSYKSHKEMICVGAAPDDDATVKEVAQDWLNKLVAQCANFSVNAKSSNCTEKSDSSTPQFTEEEIEAIRKIAQFMGVTVADSIIAKCDAMLEGAEE